ncbi:quinone oxidoreductase-like isoform X2 [Daphnia pulex]|nr:quinone oxidoreductase-like isoform X2 [Daphnia pulex]XP_046459160.1 quinone oxidoreductase-like isoform X2 [Daphnia pulex]XP_046459161.1 quinone oxidoreductase-like isoform X2 [Daphnia pulex]
MKAVRVHSFGGPEVLKVESDVPIPIHSETQVLVRVGSAGVNPVDTYIRMGLFAQLPTLPYIPGRDGSGTIEKVGSQVETLKVGDRVFFSGASGSYAEYVACESHSVYHLPERLSFAQGAALGVPYFTAYRAIFLKGKARPGDRVLVHGASGAVGLAACQLAKAHGMTVCGTAGSESGLELVKKNGAHLVFNHKEKGYLEEAAKAVGGQGFDVIIENASDINLDKDLTVVAPNARIVVVGNRGSVEISPRYLMAEEASIIGCALFRSTPEEWVETAAAVVSGLDVGFLSPFVDKEYPMENVQDSHADVLSHEGGSRGKLVLTITK